MLLNIFDEFVVDEDNALKDEGEDAIFDTKSKDFGTFKTTSNRKDWLQIDLHLEYGGVLLLLCLLLVGTSWGSDWST